MERPKIELEGNILSVKGEIDGHPAMWIGNISQTGYIPKELFFQADSDREQEAQE